MVKTTLKPAIRPGHHLKPANHFYQQKKASFYQLLRACKYIDGFKDDRHQPIDHLMNSLQPYHLVRYTKVALFGDFDCPGIHEECIMLA